VQGTLSLWPSQFPPYFRRIAAKQPPVLNKKKHSHTHRKTKPRPPPSISDQGDSFESHRYPATKCIFSVSIASGGTCADSAMTPYGEFLCWHCESCLLTNQSSLRPHFWAANDSQPRPQLCYSSNWASALCRKRKCKLLPNLPGMNRSWHVDTGKISSCNCRTFFESYLWLQTFSEFPTLHQGCCRRDMCLNRHDVGVQRDIWYWSSERCWYLQCPHCKSGDLSLGVDQVMNSSGQARVITYAVAHDPILVEEGCAACRYMHTSF